MKYIVNIIRIFVGVLFIISGFIKLNDPLGFSYKLEEYFSADVLNMPFFEPYALAISIFVVIIEVILGAFLILGYKKKFTIWSLFLMIVFFTFLTFYSAYFDKVKDCGCFGDALKLTPWESFTKDVVLLVLILIIWLGIKHIKPLFNKGITNILSGLSIAACVLFCYHVMNHLPSIDFRAYKIGDNLLDNMIVPEDAPKAVQEYTWTFNVNGEEKEFVTNGSYPKVDGEYVGVETEVIEEGYEPPIMDFSIETNDEELTEQFLSEDNLVMIVSYSLENINEEGANKIKSFSENAIRKGYKVIGVTSSGDDAKQQFKNQYNWNFNWYLCDEKALKTVVRSNPGMLTLEKGTVTQKVHWKDVDKISFKELPNALPKLNFELKKSLDSVLVLDQKYRADFSPDTWKLQEEIDSSNTKYIESLFEEYGYPGKSLVGEPTNRAAWYVIQHSNKISDYLPLIKKAAEEGELPLRLFAMMEDRYLMNQGKEQNYGTQGITLNQNLNPLDVIWPIIDAENVNKRRAGVGFQETIEEYAKNLFGESYEFKNYSLYDIKSLEKENPWILGLLKDLE